MMDCSDVTDQNVDELLPCDGNVVYNNTYSYTGAFDCKTGRGSSKLSNFDACDPGYELVELVVIDITQIGLMTHIASDFDVKPNELEECEDSKLKAAVEIKPIEIKPEICDMYSQDQAPTPACDLYDKTKREHFEVAGQSAVGVKYHDNDEQSVADLKISSKEDLVGLASFEGSEICEDFIKGEAFQSINKCGVPLHEDKTSEQFSTDVKIEKELSKVVKVQDESLKKFDVRVKVANSSDVGVKNESSAQVSSDPIPKLKGKKINRWHETFCDLCKVQFRTNIALMAHKKNHDKKRKHVCKICGLRFGDTPFLKKHMRVHFSESYYPCGICGRTYNTAKKLEIHARRHRPEEKHPICDICGETVAQGFLNIHKLEKHKELFTCSKCSRCYSSKTRLILHQCLKDRERKKVSCAVCSEVCSSFGTLEIHMTLHGGEVNSFCHLCGEGFTHLHYLDQHFVKAHPNEKCYNCNECERKYATRGLLRKHQKVHSKKRPYLCSACNIRFVSKVYFKTHMKRHAAESPFKCNKCGRDFGFKEALWNHVNGPCGCSNESE